MNPQLSNLYKALQAVMPPTAFDPLQEVVELIATADCLIGADDRGITFKAGDSTHRVDLPGGLSEPHYRRLAPLLVDDNKVVLALAVIRNAIQPKTWLDWESTKTLARDLYRMVGDDDYQGMLRAVDASGFAVVVSDLKAKLVKMPKAQPRRRRLVVVEKPAWDGNVLSFGNKTWKFRKQRGGPVRHLLDAFERKGWPYSHTPNDLAPERVVEARRQLQERTGNTIMWSASNDGQISWMLP